LSGSPRSAKASDRAAVFAEKALHGRPHVRCVQQRSDHAAHAIDIDWRQLRARARKRVNLLFHPLFERLGGIRAAR